MDIVSAANEVAVSTGTAQVWAPPTLYTGKLLL
jgi:hypothetical protein